MENVKNAEANVAIAQECCAPAAKSGWLNPRNLLISVALAGGAGALVFGWDWLVAAGLASVVVMMLTCGAMCALGLCMNRQSKSDQAPTATPPAAPGPVQRAAMPEPASVSNAPSPENRA